MLHCHRSRIVASWPVIAITSAWICLVTANAIAAEATTALIPDSNPVEMPGVGRVLFGFLLVAGLAAAILFGLRRVLPTLGVQTDNGNELKILSRASVHRDLRLHVVEVRGRTILVAESKNGIAMTPIEEAREPRPGL